jgi:predicted S18 family serine protease
MAVGFAALLKGDHVQRGIALTGTIDKDGRIGSVGGIPDKVRAAAREGYRTVLIPEGQLADPRWNLTRLGWELNVEIREVGTIEQAYQLMTGNALY